MAPRKNRRNASIPLLLTSALAALSPTACGLGAPSEGEDFKTQSAELASNLEAVGWKDVVEATVKCLGASCSTGNDLVRATSNPSATTYGAGATSTQTIAAGQGYVEAAVATNQLRAAFGLTNRSVDQSANEIDYAFVLDGANATISENGVKPPQSPDLVIAAGDKLRVFVDNTGVRYFHKGKLVYTSTVEHRYPLIVDAALSQKDSTIHNAWVNYPKPTPRNVTTNQVLDFTTANEDDIDNYTITVQPNQSQVWLRYEGDQSAARSSTLDGQLTPIVPNQKTIMNVTPKTEIQYVYVRVWAKYKADLKTASKYRLFVTAPPHHVDLAASTTDKLTNLADPALLNAKSAVSLTSVIRDAFNRPVAWPLSTTLRAIHKPGQVVSAQKTTTEGNASATLALPDCTPGAKTIEGSIKSGPFYGTWSVNYNPPSSGTPSWPRYEASVQGLPVVSAPFVHVCKETRQDPQVISVYGDRELTGTLADDQSVVLYNVNTLDTQHQLFINLTGNVNGTATILTSGDATALAPGSNTLNLPPRNGELLSVLVKVSAKPGTLNESFNVAFTAKPYTPTP